MWFTLLSTSHRSSFRSKSIAWKCLILCKFLEALHRLIPVSFVRFLVKYYHGMERFYWIPITDGHTYKLSIEAHCYISLNPT
ncbi:hypothetical protein GDO81_022593 [Engystomops pustulosus]|uniref:Uncharacterized protein n=1 Tax=Engystomops pustulosus TaxID=76066 RepID=A0AAV6YQX2_ENGPU|nr:hypothetical protein GDO81_022593 [Engystomops pustulosus]